MDELIRDFAKDIREMLKQKINASIYIEIVQDMFVVRITHFDMMYQVYVRDLSEKLNNNYTKSRIVNDIIVEYKDAIFSLYFYTDNSKSKNFIYVGGLRHDKFKRKDKNNRENSRCESRDGGKYVHGKRRYSGYRRNFDSSK